MIFKSDRQRKAMFSRLNSINTFADIPYIRDADVEQYRRTNQKRINDIDNMLASKGIPDDDRMAMLGRRKELEELNQQIIKFGTLGTFSKKYHITGDYKTGTKIEGKMGKHGDVWRAETELPEFDTTLDDPTNKYRHHDIALTEMSPDEFIKIQYEQHKVRPSGHESPLTYEEWAYPYEPKVEEYRKILRGEKHEPVKNIYGPDSKLPIPIIEYDEEGNLTGFQEGFHRGLAAKREGLETMPVLIARKHVRTEL